MRDLHIVDYSATAHGGDKGHFKANNFYGFPTGAIFNTFKTISKKSIDLSQDKVVFCFDRRSKVKDIDANYKSNRKSWSSRMYYQSKLFEEMVSQMGFESFAVEEFEADWLIISLVLKYWRSFRHIYIYGTDRDLACVVAPNVTFVSTHQYVPSVTMANYEEVMSKETWTPYNTVLLSKVFRGDKSDVIAPVVTPDEYMKLLDDLRKANFPFQQLYAHQAIEFVLNNYDCPADVKQQLYDNWEKVKYHYIDLELSSEISYNLEAVKVYSNTFGLTQLAKKFGITLDFQIPASWELKLDILSQICFWDSLSRNKDNILSYLSEYRNNTSIEHLYSDSEPDIYTVLANRHIPIIEETLVKYELPAPYYPTNPQRYVLDYEPICTLAKDIIFTSEVEDMALQIVTTNEKILFNNEVDVFKEGQTFCKIFDEIHQLTLRCTYLQSPVEGVNYYNTEFDLVLNTEQEMYPTLIAYFEDIKTKECIATQPFLFIPPNVEALVTTMQELFTYFKRS